MESDFCNNADVVERATTKSIAHPSARLSMPSMRSWTRRFATLGSAALLHYTGTSVVRTPRSRA